ncbi:MAG: M3 family metallopeptidase [Gammaproteobacteria bacterium]
MTRTQLTTLALSAVFLTACDTGSTTSDDAASMASKAAAVADATSNAADAMDDITVTAAELAGNPLVMEWDTPYGAPPFDKIDDAHFMPAMKKGIVDMRAEIASIVDSTQPPTFDNTIVALEKTGNLVSKVARVFSSLTGTERNDALSALESKIWPMLTREQDKITLNDTLFARVKSVYDQRATLDLDEQDARLLELTHRNFVRAGAALAPEVKTQVAAINAELSGLTTTFGQNLIRETKSFKINVTDEADVAGLSDDFKAALWDDEANAWVLGLDRSVYENFMVQSENRDLRKRMFDGYTQRASQGEYDNGPVLVKIAQLRAKRAELMGYASHAHYELETRMAKTPQGAEDFLKRVWAPGLEKAKIERSEMQEIVGDAFTIESHDWWHYAEKVRQAKYAFDENALKPYFELNAVRGGAFEMARRLFNVTFEPVDIDTWNDVVTSYEVKDLEGNHVGLFMMDMYARSTKRGGAWMSGFRGSWHYDGEDEVRPIVTNNLNLTSPPEGDPTLMKFSEVETLFHEFGHGLHGLLTQVDYSAFSGVDGPRDYTEFPAQILEHWAPEPEMLALYAKHFRTGEVIPSSLIEKMQAASNFRQGFATTEFIAASLLDLRWHMLGSEEASQITDAREFERSVLAEYGLIDEIEPRYRSQYFSHVFAGGYSAGYYAYLWSEILDADGFEAFREAEDIFDPAAAARLKKWVYESGGLREADELYRNFRGGDPSIEPLLRGRGFPVGGET